MNNKEMHGLFQQVSMKNLYNNLQNHKRFTNTMSYEKDNITSHFGSYAHDLQGAD